MRLIVSILALVPLGLILPGCVSPKFERAWKVASRPNSVPHSQALETSGGAAARRPNTRVPALPSCWEGRWHSDKHHAGGRLRAVVQPPQGGRAAIFFEAGWHGFTTAYPVMLSAQQRGKTYLLSGEYPLQSCIGGGTYRYEGTLKADAFTANYHSRYDFGTFVLSPVVSP